jgi:hypothetical protein
MKLCPLPFVLKLYTLVCRAQKIINEQCMRHVRLTHAVKGEEPVLEVGRMLGRMPSHATLALAGRLMGDIHSRDCLATSILPTRSSVAREMAHALSPCQPAQVRYITPQRYPGASPPQFVLFDTLDSFLHGFSFYPPPFPLLHLGELSPHRTVERSQ